MAEDPIKFPWGTPQQGPQMRMPTLPPIKKLRALPLLLVGIVVAIVLLANAIYTVQPTELAFTRTFGKVDQDPSRPIMPGVHLKLPFITVVDRLQVSVDTVSPPADLRVISHDGQVITLGVAITRKVPPAAVYNLLYNTGAVGNVDIDRNIFSILADRTLTIFGREDVLNIASDRERIIGLMKTVIATDIGKLYGVQLIDLQITGIRFSPEYERAVNENTLAKTNAYKAEQVLRQKEIEAQQAAAVAKGQADAAIETARGQSQSTLLNAQARAKATEIQADADAAAIKVRVDAAGGPQGYTSILAAETMKQWNGQLPATMLGGQGALPFLQIGK